MMEWLERRLLMAVTGWPPGVVGAMTLRDVRKELIFREEWQRAQKS